MAGIVACAGVGRIGAVIGDVVCCGSCLHTGAAIDPGKGGTALNGAGAVAPTWVAGGGDASEAVVFGVGGQLTTEGVLVAEGRKMHGPVQSPGRGSNLTLQDGRAPALEA